jgi:hypothetical protein
MILSGLACHTMKVLSLDQAAGRSSVSLTLSDQSVVVVDGPKIYGTKLVGFVNGIYQEIPTAMVKAVHVRETSSARTAALVAAGAVGFAGFAWVIAGAGKSDKPDYCDAPEHVDEPICQGL